MATLYKCVGCDGLWEEVDTVKLYECGSCGTVFSIENSADGIGNRCPDCNKFASVLTENGCPDCEEETEQVEAEYDEEAGELREVVPPEPVVPPIHYHTRFTFATGEVSLSDKAYNSLAEAMDFWTRPWPDVTDNHDGTFTVTKSAEHYFDRTVDFIECTEQHKKPRR